jgi:23S rRNA (cytosine1962-C5)-methyltransferase
MPRNATSFEYQLMDFGDGRKLERFGRLVLDRCCPAAAEAVCQTPCWKADVRLDEKGVIMNGRVDDHQWLVKLSGITFQLKLTPFGHVGLFPEQWQNWNWLRHLGASGVSPNPQALNLFAYTGGSTLALAQAGFQVVHVDASEPAVRWARANATLNQLSEYPVRWIVEDARKFAQRELKRGHRYDAIVLDPPSFGHGPKGLRWEIESDFYPLLEVVTKLLKPPSAVLLVTAHASNPDHTAVESWLKRSWLQDHPHFANATLSSERLNLFDPYQRQLDCGYSVRWHCGS